MKKVFIAGIVLVTVFLPGLLFAGVAPTLEVITPTRGEEVDFGESVVIAVSIYDPEGDTDIQSIEIKVDNKDVTRQANISALLITYVIEEIKTPGRHRFTMSVKDKEGNPEEITSFFTVGGEVPKDRAFTVNGTVKLGYDFDDQSSVNHVGTAEVYLYGRAFNWMDYAADVELTNAPSTDGQRVSTYRLDLYTPIGNAVLGDTTPSFSDYTIDGSRVFGVHLLPQFGFFGMELLFGQSLEPVSNPATQAQTVYGFKLKPVNTETFQLGINFLKVLDTDDPAINATAQDNIVLGADARFALFEEKLLVSLEANESLLNTDISAGATVLNELSWIFMINPEKMVPIIPGFSNFAGKAGMKLGPFFENTLNAEFSFVGPAYNSLANTAITQDRAGIKAWDTAWLFGRDLYLSLAFQYYWNNLFNTLSYTTNTLGGSGYAYIYATDYLTFNAGVNLLTSFDESKANVDSTNTTVDAGVSYDLELLETSSTAYFNGTASFTGDKVTPANDLSDYSTRVGLISYFDAIPLDTKAVVGYDFGDSPDSFYVEGKAGYWFFPEETLYTYAQAAYATGDQLLETEAGATAYIPWDVEIDAKVEYITYPGYNNLRISASATKEF
ncbi:MAG: hypothetical protein JSV25_13535 [Spirochaetota bacterium]|nr:MAG: hypothetical protein JSV25_13535 [Spirochaetota bacterium]